MPPFPVPFFNVAVNVTAGVSPTFIGRGVSQIVRNGAGDYTLTLDQAIDALESVTAVSLVRGVGAAVRQIEFARPSDTTLQVFTLQAGVATDLPFTVVVLPIGAQ